MNFTPSIIILSCLIPGILCGAESLVVNESDIESVHIYKHKDKDNRIHLTANEVSVMANAINSSSNVGLCIYAVDLWLVVSMKNGGERKFRVNGNTIKENNDICYEFQDGYGTYLYEKAHNN